MNDLIPNQYGWEETYDGETYLIIPIKNIIRGKVEYLPTSVRPRVTLEYYQPISKEI